MKIKNLLCFFFLFTISSQLAAQNKYFFINKNNGDTIKDYKLYFYTKNKIKLVVSQKEMATINKSIITKFDSIIIRFDNWYKTSLQKTDFNSKNIFIGKGIPLKTVKISSQKDIVIGNYGEPYNHTGGVLGGTVGDLLSFDISTTPMNKVSFIKYRVFKNRARNSKFIPILFIADSIRDPDKRYLYPKNMVYTVAKKMRKEWLKIDINKKIPIHKKFLFVGYWRFHGKNLRFGRKNNHEDLKPYENYYKGSKNQYKKWTNIKRFKLLTSEKYIPVIKVVFQK